jgi:hypothetical protein
MTFVEVDRCATAVGHSRPAFRQRVSATTTLIIAAVAYGVFQFILFDEARFLEWDEAVYIARSTDRFGDVLWQEHRALGVAALLAPVFAVSPSFWVMRIWLSLVSTVALALGFGAWRRSIGHGAALAMATFATSWVVLFYGSEASPNLFVAACAVGAVGLVESRASPVPTKLLAFAVALAVLFRPSDGFVLAAGIVGYAVVCRTADSRRSIAAAAGFGAIAGFLPWVVDAWILFNGPIDRWRGASEIVDGGLQWQFMNHLRLLDGPLTGPDTTGSIQIVFVVVLLVPMTIAITGLKSSRRSQVGVALTFALVFVTPYLVYVGSSAPRFLLPAFALLAVAAGASWERLMVRSPPVAAAVTAVVVACIAVSASHASLVEGEQVVRRSEFVEVGAHVQTISGGAPCHLLTQYGIPQMALTSGCITERLLIDTSACQVAALPPDAGVVIVAAVGAIPSALETAIVPPTLEGPISWKVVEVNQTAAQCTASEGG